MGRKKKVKEVSPTVAVEATSAVLAVACEPEEKPPDSAHIAITDKGIVASPVAARALAVMYSPALADEIYDMYVSGMSLHKIASVEGMPSYGSILRWYKDNEDFRKLIDGGRALKAIHHEEQALKAAEDAIGKDDVPAQRLKFDAHVWAAGVNDPSKFSKRTTVQGDPDRPIVFHISTGVPEPDDKKVIELNTDGTVKEVAHE